MKTLVSFLFMAFMAFSISVSAGNGNPNKNPGDGNNKLKTTVRCGSEKPAKHKSYTKGKIKNGAFTKKKHYNHMRKHR